MDDLSRLANLAEIIGALFVIGGIFFAVVQLRQFRQQRREMAAIELFRFFGSPDFAVAYNRVLKLPDGLTVSELRSKHSNAEASVMMISTTMENIGVMVHQRIVPSIVVANLMGTSSGILWRKLETYIRDMRTQLDNPHMFEWFEWLANMLDRIDDDSFPPAYEAYKDWRPSRSTHEF
ncbi:MAG: hypothetical protein R3358_05665 [Woeseiaceae bacterium]|nr:hypothetical protein [Woeseiaceae bacterium]